MTDLISYRFNNATIKGADGKYPITFTSATIGQPGPGTLFGGPALTQFLSLENGVPGRTSTKDLKIDNGRFACRIIFRISAPFDGRQTLVSSSKPHFVLHLTGSTVAGAKLDGRVKNNKSGWSSFETIASTVITPNVWHEAVLLYDFDTLALALDGAIQGVSAFEFVSLAVVDTESFLAIGGSVTPPPAHAPVSESPFTGDIAAFDLYDQLPPAWEHDLDVHRETAQWYLTRKRDALRAEINLGEPLGEATFNEKTATWEQVFAEGLLMFYSGSSAVFVIYGLPWEGFKSLPQTERDALGHLVSDVIATTRPGGKKSLFSKGGIYWSDKTWARPVVGQIYEDYERTGESAVWGWPQYAQGIQAGGVTQYFGGNGSGSESVFFLQNGAHRAFGMRKNISEAFLGGIAVGPERWGWPVEDQHAWVGKRAGVEVVKCGLSTFFWTAETGAFEVHGDIGAKYLDLGGPDSALGLPISNERTGNSPMDRYNYFEKGAIAWFGSKESIVVVREFELTIGSLYTGEDEGAGQGQNDLFLRVYIKHGGTQVYQGQHPPPKANGDKNYWEGNAVAVNVKMPIVMNADKDAWRVEIQVWEEDDGFGFNDRMLGSWDLMLHMYNGWGFKDTGGTLGSGALPPKVIQITATVNPKIEDPSSLTSLDKFWPFLDAAIPTLSYGQFAQSFLGVDSDGEFSQEDDRRNKRFYDNTYISLAAQGCQFGMCLEAAFAAVGQDTMFGQPLSRFKTWNDQLRWEIGCKQGRVVSTATHTYNYNYSAEFRFSHKNSIREFDHAYSLWQRQDQPLFYLYEKGTGDAWVYPINFVTEGNNPYIEVIDPMVPGTIGRVTFDRTMNKYRYRGQTWVSPKAGDGGAIIVMPRSACFRDSYWGSGQSSADEGKITTLVGMAMSAASTSASSFTLGQQPIDITGTGPEAERLRQEGKSLDGIYIQDEMPVPGLNIHSAKGRHRSLLTSSGLGSGLGGGPIGPPAVFFGPRHALSSRQNNHTAYFSPDFVTIYRGTPKSSSSANSTFNYELHLGVGKILFISGLISTDELFTIRGQNLLSSNARFTLTVTQPKIIKLSLQHNYGRAGTDAVKLLFEMQVLRAGTFSVAPFPGLTTLTLLDQSGGGMLGDIKLTVLRLRNGKEVEGEQFSLSFTPAPLGVLGVRLKLSPLFGGDSSNIGLVWLGADGNILQSFRLKAALKLRMPFDVEPGKRGLDNWHGRDWHTIPDLVPNPGDPIAGNGLLGGGLIGGGMIEGPLIGGGGHGEVLSGGEPGGNLHH